MVNLFQGKIKNLKVKHLLLCVFTFFMISSLAFLMTKNLKKIHAYDFSNFNPGNIISDGVMSNANAMSVEEIQRFLTSKNACKDTNIAKAKSYPGLRYHIENGHFVCLSEETFEHNGQKQTAAQVIYDAAKDFQINPQVLIVLLEKEQGLITDTWPNHIQYRSATGFGCPDTAECDSKYYGFRNQVRNAASMFRSVLSGGWTNYPVGKNYVQYHPNPNCGGSVINIENRATSALYRYTPYQPNVGALANYPGTSYCGAYGNRNFYVTFRQWFGSPNLFVLGDMNHYWQTHGGSAGEIGPVMENEYCDHSVPKCFQTFQNGRIYWKRQNGTFFVKGDIDNIYHDKRNELGYPLTDLITTGYDVYVQKFENGVVMKTPQGIYQTNNQIFEVWKNNSKAEDPVVKKLGFPTSDIKFSSNSKEGLYYQEYQNGVIVGNDKYGYHVSMGEIRKVWEKYGFETGILGFPTSGIIHNFNSPEGIFYQEYQNGVIVGNDKYGYHLSMGETRKVWEKNDFEFGKLGFPTSDIKFSSNSKEGLYYQEYQNGVIVGNDKYGYHVSMGEIRKVWEKYGFETGILGFPTSGIIHNFNSPEGIFYQEYQNGVIVGNDKYGYHLSMGETRKVWEKNDFEFGKLGFPTSDIKRDGKTEYQIYQHGTIYFDQTRSWVVEK
ncbi:hypothetical protein EUA80_01675 [TM7 phylum sp. oral taxon 351]|nr:hypothetical protein EUA80_01675 [TM7 phylum sp. oral taxon 351]